MIGKYIRNEKANVGVIFGLSLVPIMLAAGGAIDYSGTLAARTQIQAAVDASVLAGVALDIPDSQRESRMLTIFNANINPELRANVNSPSFHYRPIGKSADAQVEAELPNAFLRIIGVDTWNITVRAEAKSATAGGRVLDVGMCIDITGSMQFTINSVRNRAINFERDVNIEIARRGLPRFDAIRVRVMGYRDYGGNHATYSVASGGTVDKYPNGRENRGPGDARNLGDDVPMTTSGHFVLPADASAFATFVGSLQANGGGDFPESGLECVNEAMNASWIKPGDSIADTLPPARSVFPMIVVWTDIDAHPPGFSWSLLNPNYPPANVMPRTYAGLEAKWNDATRLDQANKLLVTFMPGSGTPVWDHVRLWPQYYSGGTLSDGNTNMVAKIVNAIDSLPKHKIPLLTQ